MSTQSQRHSPTPDTGYAPVSELELELVLSDVDVIISKQIEMMSLRFLEKAGEAGVSPASQFPPSQQSPDFVTPSQALQPLAQPSTSFTVFMRSAR